MSGDGLTAAYRAAQVGNRARYQRNRPDPIQRTPDGLFRWVDDEFHFTLDAAASDLNAKCDRYFTIADDALGQDWGTERVWLNPPFGKGMKEWMRKAWESAEAGALVVVLCPSATDQDWWHEYVCRADEVRYIRGRVYFDSESGKRSAWNAFLPVSLIVFRPRTSGERVSLEL